MLIIREAVDRYDESIAVSAPEEDEDPESEGAVVFWPFLSILYPHI